MGSESVSTLILFIAAMLVAAAVAGTLVTNVHDISGSIDTYSGEVRDEVETDISIISDPGSDAVYDEEADEVVVLVRNDGERTLASDPAVTDVLLNGAYVTNEYLTMDVLEESTWRSSAVVELRIDVAGVDAGVEDGTLETREHRVTVSVDGDQEVFQFYGP